MIRTTGTETTEGFIPHLLHNGVHMPVRTCMISAGSAVNIPVTREDGRLCYAKPGGGTHIGPHLDVVAV
jgi:hypothetical protein